MIGYMVIGFVAGGAAVGVLAAVLMAKRAKEQQQSQTEAEERAKRAEQLAYAGTLAGGLIHEVRNPLNTLNLNLQLLAEDWRDMKTPDERRALKRIQLLQSETRRLAAILDDFMAFVQGHRLMLADCDVNRLVDEILTFVEPDMAAKRIEIRKGLGELPLCRLDVNLIKHTLLNLLLNAEQAMADGELREIIVRTAPANDGVRIDVIDTGKGMTAENQGRIFDAFYSTKKGGTGLGLPMARRIVEEHGGRLVAHSDYGRGSCFTVTLPARPPGEEAESPGEQIAVAEEERDGARA